MLPCGIRALVHTTASHLQETQAETLLVSNFLFAEDLQFTLPKQTATEHTTSPLKSL